MLDKDLNPPEYDPEYSPLFCEECGEPLFLDDMIYDIGGEIYCDDCGQKFFKRLVSIEDLNTAMRKEEDY